MEDSQWRTCLLQAHPQLDAALKLFTSHWVLALALQERQLSMEEQGLYCRPVLLALHWAGGPGSALTAFAVAVPAAACEGITTEMQLVATTLRHPGVLAEEDVNDRVTVGILLFERGELHHRLESTPANSHVVAFDELFPDGLLTAEELVGEINHWGILAQPTTLSIRDVLGLPHIVRITSQDCVPREDEGYRSGGDIEAFDAVERVRGVNEELGQPILPEAARVGPCASGAPLPAVFRAQTHMCLSRPWIIPQVDFLESLLRHWSNQGGAQSPILSGLGPPVDALPDQRQRRQGEILKALQGIHGPRGALGP
eukprot:5869821-Amphidinium_carterae.1